MKIDNVVHLSHTYEGLVEEGRKETEQQENHNWKLGELSVLVLKHTNQTLEQYAEDIEQNVSTLKDCHATVVNWQQKVGRPTFAIARALNPHPDRYKIVAEKPSMTRKEAREIMRELRENVEHKEKIEALLLVIRHGCASAISMAPCDCRDLENEITPEVMADVQNVIDTWTRVRDYLHSLGIKE